LLDPAISEMARVYHGPLASVKQGQKAYHIRGGGNSTITVLRFLVIETPKNQRTKDGEFRSAEGEKGLLGRDRVARAIDRRYALAPKKLLLAFGRADDVDAVRARPLA
jgi:hypothetical protein